MASNRYDLSNHAFRARALETFFTAKNIRNQFGRISNQGDWFELELADNHIKADSIEFQTLLLKLNQTCGTHLPLEIISLQQALQHIISQSEADNIFNHTACASLLANCFDFKTIIFDVLSGQLAVTTTSKEIGQLFTTLRHPQLQASNTQLGIKLYDYLSAHSAAIFLVQKGQGQPSSLFLNNQFFPKDQVLLSEESQADGSIKITPYMLVTQPITPPTYHFILDRSLSMEGEKLRTAKNSLLKFAQILFQFAPNARLNINTFSDDSIPLRPDAFRATDLNNGTLSRAIHGITTSGDTNIAKACRMKIREFLNNQNNVVLFTDGVDSTTDHASLAQELALLPAEQKIKNKFFIISFEKQPDVLEELTRQFRSSFFVEKTANLQDILADHGQLQTWAAARDLFTTRVQIAQSINGETVTQVYTNAMMQSNQVEALTSFTVQPGDEVHIEVTDSFNHSIVTTTQVIGRKAPPPITTENPRPASPGANSMFHHAISEKSSLNAPVEVDGREDSPSTTLNN